MFNPPPKKDVSKYDFGLPEKIFKEGIEENNAQRSAFLKEGLTETASSSLGLEQKLKQDYLLQMALQFPKEYIKKRTDILEEIKLKVDAEFISLFKRFSSGKDGLPSREAKALAQQGAKNVYEVELLRLESLYPSEFGKQAYEIAINKKIAEGFNK